MADNNEDENAENEADNDASIDLSDLSEEQMEALASNPEVRKMLRYEDTSIPRIAAMLRNLLDADEGTDEADAADLLVSGVAERSGRVTESTVEKVLRNVAVEYEDAQ